MLATVSNSGSRFFWLLCCAVAWEIVICDCLWAGIVTCCWFSWGNGSCGFWFSLVRCGSVVPVLLWVLLLALLLVPVGIDCGSKVISC